MTFLQLGKNIIGCPQVHLHFKTSFPSGEFLHRHHIVSPMRRMAHSYHFVGRLEDVFPVPERGHALVHQKVHDDVFALMHPVVAILTRVQLTAAGVRSVVARCAGLTLS